MAWEYEGLFDAVPEDEGLLAEYWRTEATSTRIGSMGYRTRTIKAGERLEAEVYPIFGRSQEQTARREKLNMTRERQAQLNTKRAKRRLVLLMETNFRTDEDVHVTLTYAGAEPGLERCKKDVRNFLNRVKRQRDRHGLSELKYIYAIGHDADQRIHVHLVMNGGISRDRLEANCLSSVRQFFRDHIIRVFKAAANGRIAEFIQISMQLKNHIRSNGDIIIAFMNRVQNIAITGNFSFAPPLWCSLVHHDLFQPLIGGDDALDTVGCLRALDLCDLQQFGKGIFLRFYEKILLAFLLMDLSQV